MSNSDKQACGALASIILIHVAVLLTGLLTSRFFVIVYLNLTASVSLLIYWAQKQIRIQQHIVERREILVLGFEVLIAGYSIFTLTAEPTCTLTAVHVVLLSIHLIALFAFFIFMLTFRIKKLF
ncbi:hypothetical protein [Chryseolinea lacunae]|uniref:Uncharacterized protein n=1 Tax=Chryseolinea lacunae TaxID=2801331 RepID=A0ABS1L2G9_9BACT|nr:hypothetical protein [Chryseolinea lacunae]MBL0745860.1 hypothetical protein [Chryseolinea lacunae]